MTSRTPSMAWLAARALDEAEEMLRALPHTPTLWALHARLIALKSVATGHLRERHLLPATQEAKFAKDAVAFAREVAELYARLRR
jgi:hypothetical protein